MENVGQFCYAATRSWTVGASPTDVCALVAGSKGATVGHVYVSSAQAGGANANAQCALVRRAANNSGGVAVVVTPSGYERNATDPLTRLHAFTTPPTGLAAELARFRTSSMFLAAGSSSGTIEWLNHGEQDNVKHCIQLGPGEALCVATEGLPNGATFRATFVFIEPFN